MSPENVRTVTSLNESIVRLTYTGSIHEVTKMSQP